MAEREKLLELLINYGIIWYTHKTVDYLLQNGVVVKESGKWEDGIIQGVYSSYDKAYEAMCAAIDKVDSVKVDWANEDCGFTTVYSIFGDVVEFEISDEYAVQ